ncbi:MAG TPA: extracellular solute-binding protein [Micromonosporaceae bacterium]|nr:extracellular solute-binding protein [Micromonosporaceae bacterium]
MHAGSSSTIDTSEPANRPTGSRRTLLRAMTAAAIALPLALAGCGGGEESPGADSTASAGPVKLSVFWWGGQARADLTTKVLELYTQKHPNVTFTPEWQANQGYTDKLSTRAAANDLPDIFQLDDGMLADYAKRNVTADLTRYVGKNIKTDKVSKSLVDYGKLYDKNFGIPLAENTPAVVYDKTVLKTLGLAEPEMGWTLEQWIDLGKQVKAKSNGATLGIMDGSADYRNLWVWMRQQGKELYTKDGKLGVTTEDATKWFQLWADARAQNATPPADILHTINTGNVAQQGVATKKTVNSYVWSNQLAELQKATPNELGITSNPGDPKGNFARASLYFAVGKQSKNAAVAADVINFFVNDPEAAKILGYERGLPANNDNRSAVAAGLTPPEQLGAKFSSELAGKFASSPSPNLPPKGHPVVRQKLIDSAESVQFGKATPAAAAQAFVDAAKLAIGG